MERQVVHETDVLVVEDNAVDAMFIMKALKNSGVTEKVIIATDGKMALDFFTGQGSFEGRDTESLPKLIILDLTLPQMSGFEFLHKIRSYPKYRDIPVAVFSGSNDDHDKKMALDLGADSYFTKPLSIHAFVAIVEEIGKFWLQTNTAE